MAGPAALGREAARALCADLETGNIVYSTRTPIEFSEHRLKCCWGANKPSASVHKNIAYRPVEDRVTGLDKSGRGTAVECLRAISQDYSRGRRNF